MRRAAKIDDSQPEIVKALEAAGACVQSLAALGGGVPDLLVCFRDRLFLLECKTGWRTCDRKLTKDQQRWHMAWLGPVYVVSTGKEALGAVGIETGDTK